MDDNAKKQLEHAINEALKNGFDSFDLWKGDKFALVLKSELTFEAAKYIREYLGEVEAGQKVEGLDPTESIKRAKAINAEMKKAAKKGSSSEYSPNADLKSVERSIGSIFPFITEVTPYDPKTQLTPGYEFGQFTLTPKYSEALKFARTKGVNVKYFSQKADVDDKDPSDDKTPGGYDLTKIADLRRLFDDTKKVTGDFNEQQQAVLRMYDLAARRALAFATEIGDTGKITEINKVLGGNIYETWKNANKPENSQLNTFVVKDDMLVSPLIALGTDMNDEGGVQRKKRAVTSDETYTFKREKGFKWEVGQNISYAGVIPANGTKVKNPEGVLKDQQEASKAEKDEIDAIITVLQGEKPKNPYKDFGDWVTRKQDGLNDREKKAEKETEIETPEKQGKQTDNKPKNKVENKVTDKAVDKENKKDAPPKDEEVPRFVIKPEGFNEYDPRKVALDYKGLDITKSNFANEMLDDNSFDKWGKYIKHFFITIPVIGQAAVATLALVRSSTYVVKGVGYTASRIRESDNIDKSTEEKLEKRLFKKLLNEIDLDHPNLDNFEVIDLKLATRGDYNEDKFNRILKRKEEEIIKKLEKMFFDVVDEDPRFSPKQKVDLKLQFSDKIRDGNVVSATENQKSKYSDARNDGYIEFSMDQDEAREALQSSILKQLNKIVSTRYFQSTKLKPFEAVSIFNEYLKNHGMSDFVSFTVNEITQPSGKKFEQVEVTLSEGPDNKGLTIDQLKFFNHFMLTEVNSPTKLGLPEELTNPMKKIERVNSELNNIMSIYQGYKESKNDPAEVDKNGIDYEKWKYVDKKIKELEEKYKVDVDDLTVITGKASYNMNSKEFSYEHVRGK